MSETESTDSDISIPTLLHSMQEMMQEMLDETDASLLHMKHLYKEIHHSQDLYVHLHLEDALKPFLHRWIEEGRISETGLTITLTEEEQVHFSLKERVVSIYEVCEAIIIQKTA